VRNKANLPPEDGRPSPRPEALTLPPAERLPGLIVQNKANLGERGGDQGANWAKQTQFRSPRPSTAPTIPIFRHSIIPVRRRLCKTNPIWLAGADLGGRILRNKAKPGHPGVSGGPDAGRRADAPNKANCPKRAPRRCLRRRRGCTSKPNFRSGRLGQGLGHEGLLCETNPISGSPAGTEERNMRNKPNLRGEAGQSPLTPRPSPLGRRRLYETKPILGLATASDHRQAPKRVPNRDVSRLGAQTPLAAATRTRRGRMRRHLL
jgi:hypothetical protein